MQKYENDILLEIDISLASITAESKNRMLMIRLRLRRGTVSSSDWSNFTSGEFFHFEGTLISEA